MAGGAEERERVLVAGRRLALDDLEEHLEQIHLETGAELLVTARTARPLLIVLDAALEAPDVLTVLERLRRDDLAWAVPTVVLSSGDSPELESRALELGASDVISASAPARVRLARLGRLLREGRERMALAELAQTDGLTGLANFRALKGRLEQEFKRAHRYRHPLTVVMIDLDHLKPINDRLGHEVGNRAIVSLARHLNENLREVDYGARFGGDEFVALLPYQTPGEAEHFAQRLRAGLRTRKIPGAEGLRVTVSVGIAGHTPEHPQPTVEALLGAADAALYLAKRQGRDRVCVADESTFEAHQ